MLNQGRRVNKSSAILNKNNILITLLLVIIIQANVLKNDLEATKGPHPYPGYDCVSRNNLKPDLKNDVILLTIRNKIQQRKTKNLIKYNVIKLINSSLKCLQEISFPKACGSSTRNVLRTCENKISNLKSLILTSNVEINKYLAIICISTEKMLSLTIFKTKHRIKPRYEVR